MDKPNLTAPQTPPQPWANAIFVANLCVWIVLPGTAAFFCLIDGINTWEAYKFVLAAIGGAAAVGGWYFMRALERPKP